MKIVQIIPELSLAGAEIMVENLSYALKALNHDVYVISLYSLKTPISERLEKKGIDVFYLNKKTGFDLTVIKKIREKIIEIDPDIVHTHRYLLPYVTMATIGLRVKIIHTVHNVAEKEVSSKQQIIHSWLYNRKKITPVAISPLVLDSIKARYKRIKTVPVIYNGIDLGNCHPKTDYSLTSQKTVLHIGRFSYQKNHELLIDAFEKVHLQMPEVKLQLIGGGELENDIKEKVASSGLTENVKFLGLQDDVYKYLVDADIFILPSRYEGMPITLIEAMGTGLPIIATPVGGVPDMIQNSISGLLVESSAYNLSSAIINLLEDGNLRKKLGENAEKDSKRFSSMTMAKNYIDIYNNVQNENQG